MRFVASSCVWRRMFAMQLTRAAGLSRRLGLEWWCRWGGWRYRTVTSIMRGPPR